MNGRALEDVLTICRRASAADIDVWIERRWVRPHRTGAAPGGGWVFSAIDLARVELICDLRDDLALDEEAVPVALSLIDTVYAQRRRLNLIAAAVARLPPEVQSALGEELRKLAEE